MTYNEAFFGLYKDLFVVLRKELGEKKALELFTKIIEKGLKEAYDALGFKKGDPQEFARVVAEQDRSVGLQANFPEATEEKIVYHSFKDPFSKLRGEVAPQKLDATYMNFKVNYLLGDNWQYKATKHLWKGDTCIEYSITKKK
ncbi:hypothetical protein KKE06_03090 [Candidatus Micrarchaeota archaeon]|nr:hypothetical protein [Candidatus Micrarchaeota archaeon]MBU1930974.1 hypothetical protein [Candidatus Micrarchaeota archaeon]